MEIRGAVAVITGGGTGIGRATALALAEAGAAGVVAAYSRSAADAESLLPELKTLGARGLAEPADVTDDAAVRALAATARREFGRVDILVNNAGITRAVADHDLEGLSDADFHDVLDVNVIGAFRCARAFAPALRSSGGAIVNIASISGYRAGGSSIAYGVSKAALLQLTRNLASALAPQVRVNAVAPGTVATRWQTGLHGEEGFAERAREERESVPLRATARAEDVAQAVLGLLRMDLVTGESVIVDGGKHIRY
ncbi:SDR family oxidoreductase [Streptomyces sp. A7024]|uniref:SDR family oxidoreductase n=1 Tax=Streptomyces coryli TaxID=1128680 RepID=A0A6G4U5T5_9ACTN|nr:SDR family oxidoreductase [Streptomyces coryli]